MICKLILLSLHASPLCLPTSSGTLTSILILQCQHTALWRKDGKENQIICFKDSHTGQHGDWKDSPLVNKDKHQMNLESAFFFFFFFLKHQSLLQLEIKYIRPERLTLAAAWYIIRPGDLRDFTNLNLSNSSLTALEALDQEEFNSTRSIGSNQIHSGDFKLKCIHRLITSEKQLSRYFSCNEK